MNDPYNVTTYVVIDDILKAYGDEDDCRATGRAAEIVMVGVRRNISRTIPNERCA